MGLVHPNHSACSLFLLSTHSAPELHVPQPASHRSTPWPVKLACALALPETVSSRVFGRISRAGFLCYKTKHFTSPWELLVLEIIHTPPLEGQGNSGSIQVSGMCLRWSRSGVWVGAGLGLRWAVRGGGVLADKSFCGSVDTFWEYTMDCFHYWSKEGLSCKAVTQNFGKFFSFHWQ